MNTFFAPHSAFCNSRLENPEELRQLLTTTDHESFQMNTGIRLVTCYASTHDREQMRNIKLECSNGLEGEFAVNTSDLQTRIVARM